MVLLQTIARHEIALRSAYRRNLCITQYFPNNGKTLLIEASTLIFSELALAIEMGATVEDLALTIHPHPTLGGAIMEAAEKQNRLSIVILLACST